MLRARPPALVAAALVAVTAAALAALPHKAPAPPLAVVTSVSGAPDEDGGSVLADACSRRVGCLLR